MWTIPEISQNYGSCLIELRFVASVEDLDKKKFPRVDGVLMDYCSRGIRVI